LPELLEPAKDPDAEKVEDRRGEHEDHGQCEHPPGKRIRPPLAPAKPNQVVPHRVHLLSPLPEPATVSLKRVALCRRFGKRLDNGAPIPYMKGVRLARRAVALMAGGLTVVAVATAASHPPNGPAAKEYLASARALDRQALNLLRSTSGLPAARMRVRSAHAALAAALDTLGAAQLPLEPTRSIERLLIGAASDNARALAGPAARAETAVAAALAKETRAATLLGNAPGAPTIYELPIPISVFGAWDMALGPDGRSVWVSGPDASRIVLYPSLATGTTPVIFRLPPGSSPHGVAFGPDGALYVALTGTNIGGNAIARLGSDGAVRTFPLPTGSGAPWGIAVGGDDKIWFTEVGSGKVGRLDPGTGLVTEFALPTANSQPQGIVRGPDGALWGTEANGNRVFRMGLDGRATEFPIPTPNSVPVAIAPGRGGVLWVSELSGGKLLRISRTGKIREFPLPAGARPYGVASAPDGNVWYADRGRNRVGLVTPAGRVFEYRIPTPNAQPTAILPLGLGQFAFTEFVSNRIGVLRFPGR
jgi:virginiamycin B lyase